MNITHKLAIVSTGFLLLGNTIHTQEDFTKERAIAIAHKSLNSLGITSSLTVDYAKPSAGKSTLWRVSLRQSATKTYALIIDSNSRRVVSVANSDRGYRTYGLRRTGKPFFLSESLAKAHVLTLFQKVKSTHTFELDEFRYKPDQNISGKFQLGEVWARFNVQLNGFPILDRSCFISMRLDPQDGDILSYNEKLSVPPPVVDRTVNLSEIQAKAKFLESVAGLAKSVSQHEIRLGYAVPQGEAKARLCWRMWKPGDPSAYFIDAKSGQFLGKLP